MRSVSSAFWLACQQDTVLITELITMTSKNKTWRWAISNDSVISSGYNYIPFPGNTAQGIEEGIDLTIATIDFTITNSGSDFDYLMANNDLEMASVVVKRVLTNSPDLGSVEIYRGKLGDYGYNRDQITGQARNFFNSINIEWPYYTYLDQCAWRFGSPGCGYDTSSVTVSSIVANVSSGYRLGVFVAISSKSPGYYERGRFTLTSGANSGSARSVRTHTGQLIEFSHAYPYPIADGDTFSLYPGCRKRLIDDCTSKFNNAGNFLGFPWIPKQENAF
jgi:uncharacterized phage protein (TIGR02218 family)